MPRARTASVPIGWLIVTARWTLLDHHRAAQRQDRLTDALFSVSRDTGWESPESQVVGRRILIEALGQLGERDRHDLESIRPTAARIYTEFTPARRAAVLDEVIAKVNEGHTPVVSRHRWIPLAVAATAAAAALALGLQFLLPTGEQVPVTQPTVVDSVVTSAPAASDAPAEVSASDLEQVAVAAGGVQAEAQGEFLHVVTSSEPPTSPRTRQHWTSSCAPVVAATAMTGGCSRASTRSCCPSRQAPNCGPQPSGS